MYRNSAMNCVIKVMFALHHFQLSWCASYYKTELVAGNNEYDYSEFGPKAYVYFHSPNLLVGDQWSNIYLADYHHCLITRIDTHSGIVKGQIGKYDCSTDYSDYNSFISQVTGQAADNEGNIYFSSIAHDIRRYDIQSGEYRVIAGQTNNEGFDGDGGWAIESFLNQPGALSFGANYRYLYFADVGNHAIRAVDFDQEIMMSVANVNRNIGCGGDGSFANQASFSEISGLWTDTSNILYVLDSHCKTVRTISFYSGFINLLAGSSGDYYSADSSPATSASFSYPEFMFGDPVHNLLYVTGCNNDGDSHISKINLVTGIMTSLIRSDLGDGYGGDGGPVSSARFDKPGALWVDSTGNLYIVDRDNHVIRRVEFSTQIVTTYAGMSKNFNGDGRAAINATMDDPRQMVFDSLDNLYFFDSDNSRLRKIDTNSIITTVAGNGNYEVPTGTSVATSASIGWISAMHFDILNNYIYFLSAENEWQTKLCRFSPSTGTIRSLAHGLAWSLWVDSMGLIYLGAEAGIWTITLNPPGSEGPPQEDWGYHSEALFAGKEGYEDIGCGGDGGAATDARLMWPTSIAGDTADNIYFADEGCSIIRRVSSATTGRIITTIAGVAGIEDYNGEFMSGTQTWLYEPTNLIIRPNGDILFLDTENGLVRRLEKSSGILHSLMIQNDDNSDDDWYDIEGFAVDSHGVLYYSDSDSNSINRLIEVPYTLPDRPAAISTIAGIGNYFLGDGGPPNLAWLDQPQAVWVDGNSGDIFVSTAGDYSSRIRKLSNEDYAIYTVAGNGMCGYSGDGEAATSAKIAGLTGLTGDTNGNLYFSDNMNCVIRKVSLDFGWIDLFVGMKWRECGYNGNIDLTAATLYHPNGLAMDSSGNLYIADTYNHIIRVIATSGSSAEWPSGTICVFAGMPGSRGFNGGSIHPNEASLQYPYDVVAHDIDPTLSQGVYIADSSNGAVQFVPHNNNIDRVMYLAFDNFPAGTNHGVADEPDNDPNRNFHIKNIAIDSSSLIHFYHPHFKVIMRQTLSGGTIPVVGTGEYGYRDNSEDPLEALIGHVTGMAMGGSTELYFVDNHFNRLRGYSPSTGSVYTVAGTNQYFGGDHGAASSATLNEPTAIFGMDWNNILFVDSENYRVRMLSGENSDDNQQQALYEMSSIFGNGIESDYLNSVESLPYISGMWAVIDSVFVFACPDVDNDEYRLVAVAFTGSYSVVSIPISAQGSVYSVWGDSMGILYVSSDSAVTQVHFETFQFDVIAGHVENTGFDGDNQLSVNALLNDPRGVWGDLQGTYLYIADMDNGRIRRIDATGFITTIAGKGCSCNSEWEPLSAATQACLRSPNGVFGDNLGNLYITNSEANLIHKLDLITNVMYVIAGYGYGGFSQDGPLSTASAVYHPTGIWADEDGHVIFADTYNNRIRMISFYDNTENPSLYPTPGPSTTKPTTSIPSIKPSVIPSRAPTKVPSAAPSRQPTRVPSATPSVSPSVLPSTTPSGVPTKAPSSTPSFQPTASPSSVPTMQPSAWPTMLPSRIPTAQPTVGPTMTPTFLPTPSPTMSPSAPPSIIPTNTPTTTPTRQPSFIPSATPSALPSATPSLFPTVQVTTQPTMLPTTTPSTQPTAVPSLFPTIPPSFQPTATPSITPSMSPSLTPSAVPSTMPTTIPSPWPTIAPSTTTPTAQPTATPSVTPSIPPSLTPSAVPSTMPTTIPSLAPTFPPTATPTATPSVMPSTIPSAGPSVLPTAMPSRVPTSVPSAAPSTVPTAQPSTLPSAVPSAAPSTTPTTTVPSTTPTVSPSTVPSSPPTASPSSAPSAKPTTAPSATPTMTPTLVPSSSPSLTPTATPTAFPSAVPSGSPSVAPSNSPSTLPTLSPTATPSAAPSRYPTTLPSMCPTAMPSYAPSTLPTIAPTLQPSWSPSVAPSVSPTVTPSASPSAVPTAQPSAQPSLNPTTQPSASPSAVPTLQPSITPSATPTVTPTAVPSPVPSMLPTPLPSIAPSSNPSPIPTDIPTGLPSSLPTISPSTLPSETPTADPTFSPSCDPSPAPTCLPTFEPTIQPTMEPSIQPTMDPTTQPTMEPSSSPSQPPSITPSVRPSTTPSTSPSCVPSENPTPEPTFEPSTSPSVIPSKSPTEIPTIFPSIMPTTPPSSPPSQLPSLLPVVSPSNEPSRSPSTTPSENPTDAPSACPSTQTPSVTPTFTPTGSPSTASPSSTNEFPLLMRTVAGRGGHGISGDGGRATSAEFGLCGGVVTDTAGNLFISDTNYFVIRRVDALTTVVRTIAGDSQDLYGSATGDGGPASSATLGGVKFMFVDTAGDLFLSDCENFVVRKLNLQNGIISLLAGSYQRPLDSVEQPVAATAALLVYPVAVWGDSGGQSMFVSDFIHNTIRRVDIGTGILTLFAGNSFGQGGYNGDMQFASNALLNGPFGLWGDSRNEYLYVAQMGNFIVSRISLESGTISTFAGCALNSTFTGISGDKLSICMQSPTSVFVDSTDVVYISDSVACLLRRIRANSAFTSVIAGNYLDNTGIGDGGPAYLASFQRPMQVFGIPNGEIFIADDRAHKIRSIFNSTVTQRPSTQPSTQPTYPAPSLTPSTTPTIRPSLDARLQISAVAGSGVIGSSGDGGPAISATFNRLNGIAVDALGHIYVSDSLNNVVRKISAFTGTITNIAGDTTSSLTQIGDGGPATSARLSGPKHLALDPAGDVLFIADSDNLATRKVDLFSGIVVLFAGNNGVTNTGGDSGPATSAMLKNPYGLWGDTANNLYISDNSYNNIRKVDTNGIISTIAGSVFGISGSSGNNAPATSALLFGPIGLWGDNIGGHLYICDYSNLVIRRVDVKTGVVTMFAGQTGVPGSSGDNGPATAAKLKNTISIWGDANRNVYLSDAGNCGLRKVSGGSGIISKLSGVYGVCTGFGDYGSPAISATHKFVYQITGDRINTLYLADGSMRKVRVIYDPFHTLSPITAPTAVPTITPSEAPTALPTTSTPTLVPTTQPSCSPSVSPTVKVTSPPSFRPSRTPSATPSRCPISFSPTSFSPTYTAIPTKTSTPSIIPSPQPSVWPGTPIASQAPSLRPSTVAPSLPPSSLNTDAPSTAASHIPSLLPSSVQPSAEPSSAPTLLSEVPTSSAAPSYEATSVAPSQSLEPSLAPSSEPSWEPSEEATDASTPSSEPSSEPTSTDHSTPSNPNSDATLTPSSQTTDNPSLTLTEYPTIVNSTPSPSVSEISQSPSLSQRPTMSPSASTQTLGLTNIPSTLSPTVQLFSDPPNLGPSTTTIPSVTVEPTRTPTRSVKPTAVNTTGSAAPTTIPVTVIVEGGEYEIQPRSTDYLVNVSAHSTVLFVDSTNSGVVSNLTVSRYTIVPQSKVWVEIELFNKFTDVINLSAFAAIRALSDLNITRGSVRINLPNNQVVKLNNLNPADVDESNFIFSSEAISSSANNSEATLSTASLAIIIVVVLVVATLCAILFGLHMRRKHRDKNKIKSLGAMFSVTLESKSVVVSKVAPDLSDSLPPPQQSKSSDGMAPNQVMQFDSTAPLNEPAYRIITSSKLNNSSKDSSSGVPSREQSRDPSQTSLTDNLKPIMPALIREESKIGSSSDTHSLDSQMLETYMPKEDWSSMSSDSSNGNISAINRTKVSQPKSRLSSLSLNKQPVNTLSDNDNDSFDSSDFSVDIDSEQSDD